MSVKITINGDPKKGIEKGNEAYLIEAAILVQSQAKALANFSQGYQTGRTRSSISWKTNKESSGDSELSVSPKQGEAYVGTNVEYASYVEFGTKKQAAQPFLRPAVGALKGLPGAKKILNDIMSEYLKKGKRVVK